ncbi:pol protein, partial [Human T-lymphotropic virus 3]
PTLKCSPCPNTQAYWVRTSSPAPGGLAVPVKPERLQALTDLVSRALEAKHIEPYQGPGNNPIFPVKKPNGKWRFIHDLRATNSLTRDLASPSPGPPDLTSLPQDLPHLRTIDLTDAFFQIPLPAVFQPYFAFTLPQPNNHGPGTRYSWRVLPQGFKNSPTLFEQQLSHILAPVRKAFPNSLIIQYMDDILLASPALRELTALTDKVTNALTKEGLPMSLEKTQATPGSIHFLGQVISPDCITYETLPSIHVKSIWSLAELQSMLGELQWVSKGTPVLRSSLHQLYLALRGHRDPRDTIELTSTQVQALKTIQKALALNCRSRLVSQLPILALIILRPTGTTAVLFQTKQKWPLVWLHTPHPATSLRPWGQLLANAIITLDKYSLQHYGQICKSFHHNISNQALTYYLHTSDQSSVAILLQHSHRFHNLGAQPSGPWRSLLQVPQIFQNIDVLRPPFIISPVVIDHAPCLFSDGATSKAAFILWDKQVIHQQVLPLPSTCSAQAGELSGLLAGLQKSKPWPALNIFLDSKFLIGHLRRMALGAFLGPSTQCDLHARLFPLLQGKTVYVHHVRSHTLLQDPISRLNEATDALMLAPLLPLNPTTLHQIIHCNPHALRNHGATASEAHAIVQACHTCKVINPQGRLPQGYIRRGHAPNVIWQGDVTHLHYKRYKYCLLVWVDTYSGVVSVSCRRKETGSDCVASLLAAISILGKPHSINTDNGTAYLSQEFQQFCSSLSIKHSTHIPYNPTSSGLVERTNGILKTLISKYLLDNHHLPLETAISKSLWTINHLNVLPSCQKTRWQLHQAQPLPSIPENTLPPRASPKWYYYKIPGLTNPRWSGPVQSLKEAAGAALIPVGGSHLWIPWRLLKRGICPRPESNAVADPETKDHQLHG